MTSPRQKVFRFSGPWMSELAVLHVPRGDTGREVLLDGLVRDRLQLDEMPAVAELVVAVRKEIEGAVLANRFPDPRRTMQEYDRFALHWWRSVGLTDDAALAPLASHGWRR